MNCPIDVQKVQIGNVIRSTATFRNALDDYSLLDPDIVNVDILDPLGNETNYTWPQGLEIIRDSLGVFYIEYLLNEVGNWYFRWHSAGNVECSTENTIRVLESRTYP